MPYFFPTPETENRVICVHGKSASKDFSALMVDIVPDLNLLAAGAQCFPLYYYEAPKKKAGEIVPDSPNKQQENIADQTRQTFQSKYADDKISKEDIFYYVYGILHSNEYKEKFSADLKKLLPHIPQVVTKDAFWAFSEAGKKLAALHINYEQQEEYSVTVNNRGLFEPSYQVKKMRFGGSAQEKDKTIIRYNDDIALSGIPLEAYEYQVNGNSAIEWVMSRYQCKTDKDSGINNNPNEWNENPHYIISLLKKVITVSMESVKIIKSLPPSET